MTPDIETARTLDALDPLAASRKEFVLTEGLIYLDGNSLGPLPAGVPERMNCVISDQWGKNLIRAWSEDGWWTAPLRIGDRIGRLLGASPGQTAVGESTSVQLFNALTAAVRLRPERKLMIVDSEHFPTDRYIATSVARLLNLEILELPVDKLQESLDHRGDEVAVIAYCAVDYRSGELWDIRGITSAAHEVGAVAVWDLCHAVGAVPLRLDTDDVDLAVGCTYKYLSGGPGSPGFIYVAARHQANFDQPLIGWHGHAHPFKMESRYQPAPGISRTRIGTPHVLSLLALDTALNVFDRVEMDSVREKSLSLGDFFLSCVDSLLVDLGFEIVTPRAHARRGSHVTLRYANSDVMMKALIEKGVIGDVRPPNLLRFGLNGLYVSYTDVYNGVATIREVATSADHR